MRKPYIYQEIKSDIIEKIESGELDADDRILSQNEMAEDYGVSVKSVRKALSELRDENYIYTRKAKGSFVAPAAARKNHSDSKLIALVVADLEHSFHAEIARACEDKIREEGYHLVFGNSDNVPDKEKSYLERFYDLGIKGAVIVTGSGSYENDYLDKFVSEVPTTIIDCDVDSSHVDFVTTDDVSGAYEAVSHLISLGHSKIAFIGHSLSVSTARKRFLGYKKALEDHYIDLDKNLIYEVGISNKELQEPARRLFDEQEDVTAIFGPNDRIAAAALHVAEQRGIQVPEDVSIVGYGNLNLDTSIPLTTVKQPAYKMGETAADLLLERIKKGDIPRQKVVLPVKLLKKGSTGPCLSQEQFSEKEEKESMVEAKIQA